MSVQVPSAEPIAATSPAGPPRPIVCAIDFSRTSISALEHACAEAERTGAAVHVVHAFEIMPTPPLDLSPAWGEIDALRGELELEIEALCAGYRARGIDIEGRVLSARPAVAVTMEVERTGAGLVVVGTHGRTGLARVALGSVAERLVRAATVSVLTVPRVPTDRPVSPRPLRVALAAVKLSGDEELVLSAARALGPEVAVRVLHVIPTSLFGPTTSRAAEIALAALAEPHASSGTPIPCEVRPGTVADEIVAEAVRCGADRAVVGTHRRGVLETFVLGSVAEEVVRRSPVPVLTVRPPPPRGAADARRA